MAEYLALIFRYVLPATFGHTLAGEITAHDKNFGKPVVLNAIVKQVTYSGHRSRMI